jgi:uncharacterized DUF497 family protein
MELSFDPAKNDRNIAERGLSFARVAELEWETALADIDARRDYGETRIRVLARLGERLHVAIVTMRGETMHVISFRKANDREVRRYAQAQGRSGFPTG